jgi:hypothetical protein
VKHGGRLSSANPLKKGLDLMSVWGHHNIKYLADFTEAAVFLSETLSETD